MKRLDALAISIWLVVFAQGCGSGTAGSPSLEKRGDGRIGGAADPGPGGLRGGEVCYPGAGDMGVCFPVVNLGQHPDYAYADPFSDPSFPAGLDPTQYRKPLHVIDLGGADTRELLAPHFEMGEFMNLDRGPYGLF